MKIIRLVKMSYCVHPKRTVLNYKFYLFGTVTLCLTEQNHHYL